MQTTIKYKNTMNTIYFVRVNGKLVGRYNTQQVAMNHASDLHFEDGIAADAITINGKSLKFYLQ